MESARGTGWANPASVHAAGRQSRGWLERARDQVAAALHANPGDVILGAGGTEACNLGVLGPIERPGPHTHLVTTEIEHPAIARSVERLTAAGAEVTRLAVLAGRAFSTAALDHAITGQTALVAIQWVNHETGTCLPIADYAQVCRARGVPLLVDATQALGKLPVDVEGLGADALAIASHKLGGPPGAGALWARRSLGALSPLLAGGGQERGRRPGTPDVIAQVGFGAACERLPERLADQPRIQALRQRMETGIMRQGAQLNGTAGARVATVVNASFDAHRGDELVAALDLEGVACASGAACSSGLPEPSPVITAMYPDEPGRARSAVRFSFGPETTESDVDRALAAVERTLARR